MRHGLEPLKDALLAALDLLNAGGTAAALRQYGGLGSFKEMSEAEIEALLGKIYVEPTRQ